MIKALLLFTQPITICNDMRSILLDMDGNIRNLSQQLLLSFAKQIFLNDGGSYLEYKVSDQDLL